MCKVMASVPWRAQRGLGAQRENKEYNSKEARAMTTLKDCDKVMGIIREEFTRVKNANEISTP